MFVSRSDLTALTGYKQPAAIARWLRANSFVFVLGVDGWPRVTLSYFESRMNGDIKPTKRVEPNRKALQEMQNGTP